MYIDEENLQKMKILENEVDELTKEKISLVQQVELRDKHLVKMEEHITAQEKSFTKEIQVDFYRFMLFLIGNVSL